MTRVLAHSRRRPAGFTLIELLVVIIIIGILIAIGVPAYLKYVASANDRDAQSALQVAYKAAVAGDTEVNNSRFPAPTTIVADIVKDEPSASVVRGSCISTVTQAPVKQVIVDSSSTSTQVMLCDRSASGTVWKLSGPLTGSPTTSDGSSVPLVFSGNEITDAARTAGVAGDGRTADSSTGIWEATTNMVTRSDYDGTNRVAQGGWSTGADTANGASSTLTQVTDSSFPVDAANVAQWAPNLPTGSGWSYAAVGVGQTVGPFVSGQQYTISFWMKLQSGPAQTLFVKVSNSNSTSPVSNQQTFTPDSTVRRYSFTFTATSAGDTPVVFINPNAVGAGSSTYRMVGFQVEQKTFMTPLVRTIGAAATRAAARVQAPTALVSATQSWFAARVRPGYPSTAPAANARLFWLAPDGTGTNRLSIGLATGIAQLITNNGANDIDSFSTSWNTGDTLTVVGAWTSSTLYLSVNGAPFQTIPRTQIPSGALTLDFGSQQTSGWFDGDFLWAATGTGTLSSADAATIAGWGDNDPKRSSFPASAQASMVWDGVGSAGSLK